MGRKKGSFRKPLTHVILDAAERVFCANGYAGASMREIAQEAGVAQALLHYYYDGKERLYEAVFERRSKAINAFRHERLTELFRQSAKPSLESVIEVLLLPSPEWLGSQTQSGEFFAPIVGAVSIGQDDRSKGLMKKYYDPIAKEFIEAFRKVVPGMTKQQAVSTYLFALGARLQLTSARSRSTRLAGLKSTKSKTELRKQYVLFVVGGIRHLSFNDKI